MKAALALCSFLMLAVPAAGAAEKPKPPKPMNAEQIAALFANGITIKVTGAGEHYSGKFVITTDGKGSGTATVNGKDVTATGTWQIKLNLFCHLWVGVDRKETCEAWVPIEDKKALILVKKVEVGIVTWE
jgi:hypothetical protein